MNSDDGSPRSRRVDVAIADFLESAERGAPQELNAFLARHSDIASELREFLADYSALKHKAPQPDAGHVKSSDGSDRSLPTNSGAFDSQRAKSIAKVVATCPNGHRLRVAPTVAGHRAKCPKCEAVFVVPAAVPEVSPNRPKKSGSKSGADTLHFADVDLGETNRPAATGVACIPGSLPRLGERFGQFELVELLGQGGFGAVYRARNPQLDRDVALKLPRPGTLDDKEEVARFLREAQAAAQLHHPYIVPVYDAGRINGIYYIASAFIAGNSLRQELDNRQHGIQADPLQKSASEGRRFTCHEVATLVCKLALALNYAHQKGIFHRDVKPANIMLDASGQPHLMDFGLARRLEGDTLRTMEGIRMGTPAYMSPEQAKGESHLADARSDLWSLGVILYELLTSCLPFDAKHLESLLVDILKLEPSAPRKIDRSIPKDLETICLKCLAKEPVRRYPTCQHLADELERWLRGEPIIARPISIPERSWRWAKRRPAIAVLSGVLLLLLATAVFVAPIVAVQQSLLRKEAGKLLTEKEEVVKQLASSLQAREHSIKERDQLLSERDDLIAKLNQSLNERKEAVAQQEQAMQLAETRNTELQETSKQRDEAVAHLSPELAANMLKRATGEYQGGRILEALAIAKVLDGGTTGDGCPYFVMELVRGIPLTQYCDEGFLNVTRGVTCPGE